MLSFYVCVFIVFNFFLLNEFVLWIIQISERIYHYIIQVCKIYFEYIVFCKQLVLLC